MSIHINRGSNTYRRRIIFCPICKRKTRFVQQINTGYYSPIFTCCSCGDSWSDGELHPRPFKPRWRQEAVRHAQKRWATALSAKEAAESQRRHLDELLQDIEAVES